MFDTHSHLFDKKIIPEIDFILNELKKENYTGVLCVLETDKDLEYFLKYYQQFSFLYCSVGIHPHNAKSFDLKKFLEQYEKLKPTNRLVAIGEIGLDFYYNFSEKNEQIKCFEEQLFFAKEKSLPVIIHSRKSNNLVLEIIEKHKINKGVIHCFSGNIEGMKKITEIGLKIGITGIITFEKSDTLKNIVSKIEEKFLVVETDSPYLTPKPFRGKINSPLYLKYIISEIASIRKTDFKTMEKILDKNSKDLFNI